MEVLYPDAVEEWIAVNLDVKIQRLSSVVNDATEQLKLGGRVKDWGLSSSKEDPPDLIDREPAE